ncbi:hypothetical protein [Lachnoclostridium sp. Marseille-P6806]|uniref:hypothetical protein n=1 Tax=Lachnoclostridium sp. Marseille-P6806 TaxID=2364793 RepID=UPI0010305BEF|nr:hypothetical protein [Lachnoclostridium sp. Marseille-P6806]
MRMPIALSEKTLTKEELIADRRKCRRYDQCGLGERAIYMGSVMHPRRYYIPYEAVSHVYKRVAASRLGGRGFLAPILYLVVRYDGGREQQCSFRYLRDCDGMQNELERRHPGICLLSPAGEARQKEREALAAKIAANELSEAGKQARRQLEKARWTVCRQPVLYERLAAMAKLKRRADNIRPVYPRIALSVLAAGAALSLLGLYRMYAERSGRGLVAALLGIMLMAVMVNSRALPSRMTDRKRRKREYEEALAAMEQALGDAPEFPLPACYAHPYVCDRLIRIVQEERTETIPEALAVLEEELRSLDSGVVLTGDDYREVVTIKPLFTCCDDPKI